LPEYSYTNGDNAKMHKAGISTLWDRAKNAQLK